MKIHTSDPHFTSTPTPIQSLKSRTRILKLTSQCLRLPLTTGLGTLLEFYEFQKVDEINRSCGEKRKI